MTDCTKLAEWELCTDDPYCASYCCTEHLSEMVADDTVLIRSYKTEDEPCCYTGIYYDTIDGKWWEFEDKVAKRPLTDEEAAKVIRAIHEGNWEQVYETVKRLGD